MPKYKVKIYPTPYIYDIEAKDKNEASDKALVASGYANDMEEVSQIEVISLEDARAEFNQLREDDKDFASEWADTDDDFEEWHEDVYLPSLE